MTIIKVGKVENVKRKINRKSRKSCTLEKVGQVRIFLNSWKNKKTGKISKKEKSDKVGKVGKQEKLESWEKYKKNLTLQKRKLVKV